LILLFLASVLLAAPVYAREIVLFDTDSTAFGDDGAALVMLLRSTPAFEIPGIAIVPGNVWPAQGAENIYHILDLLGRLPIPVYLGASAPLIHTAAMARESERRWGGLEYTGAFAQKAAELKPAPRARLTGHRPRRGGVEFLIREIERQPRQITLLALGPLTNIALALKLRPDIETRIKQIVFMGGNIKVAGNASQSAEFNFWFDPEAARIVLRSRIPRKLMFALDICNRAPVKRAHFDQIASAHTPIAELYREDAGNRYPGFLKRADASGYLWDELAAAYLIDPGFVTKSETRYLDVLTAWGKFYGSTVPLDRRLAPEATPVTVMLELDFNRVFAIVKDRLTK
jgi:inosine-uridine nucleoside N-ribohydrolase